MIEDNIIIDIAKGQPEREGFVRVGSAGKDIRLCLSLRRNGDAELLLTMSECRQVIKALEEHISSSTTGIPEAS